MYKVCVIEPTFKICGGNHRKDEGPALVYSEFPTGIMITTRKGEFRKVKNENKSFFTQLKQDPKKYCVWRGFSNKQDWEYQTHEKALEKLLYEAKGCGHYVKSNSGWLQISE